MCTKLKIYPYVTIWRGRRSAVIPSLSLFAYAIVWYSIGDNEPIFTYGTTQGLLSWLSPPDQLQLGENQFHGLQFDLDQLFLFTRIIQSNISNSVVCPFLCFSIYFLTFSVIFITMCDTLPQTAYFISNFINVITAIGQLADFIVILLINNKLS